jgi:hypothetical protein
MIEGYDVPATIARQLGRGLRSQWTLARVHGHPWSRGPEHGSPSATGKNCALPRARAVPRT